MKTLRFAGAMALVLILAACNSDGSLSDGGQAALDLLGATATILAPTPEQQCKTNGGTWQSIITYDANNNPTSSGQCVTH